MTLKCQPDKLLTMANYVDGFVLPLARTSLDAYRKVAESAGRIWIEHGALEYRETVLEDPTAPEMVTFPQLAGLEEGETVVFAWITFRSRAHRDEVNARVMADPRIQTLCDESLFDYTRMAYGGFTTLVEQPSSPE